jgi:hypothetical protein
MNFVCASFLQKLEQKNVCSRLVYMKIFPLELVDSFKNQPV